ncbi:hypothetical protein SAMD00019534_038610 [Acytostelium subglobosum LB1]|uniref:hypothetical protein n=1 Tax=Acytostelium subglobosum LB1 TaxID=1410327 RepID=UPI000644D1D7|nr:hypothetical protein SAMD00019534_038610 [Acytostelium subglobosum LB1]GAM20686.1 hypothetical protein SAMD00019534_038610 [Acytostelium subglobosum LB1]|eukprot:XP_012760207.1 hypothetical protein SAMD00019534_038610 [Acytostelium subglobosum LB1]
MSSITTNNKLAILCILLPFLFIGSSDASTVMLRRYSNNDCTGTELMVAYTYLSSSVTDILMAGTRMDCNTNGCTISACDCPYNCPSPYFLSFNTCSNGVRLDTNDNITSYTYPKMMNAMVKTSTGCSLFYSGLLPKTNQCMANFVGVNYIYKVVGSTITYYGKCNSDCTSCATQQSLNSGTCYMVFFNQGNSLATILYNQ